MIQAHPSGLLCLVKPLHAKKSLGRRMAKCWTGHPFAHLLSSGLHRIFPFHSAGPLHLAQVSLNPSMGQHPWRAQIRMLKRPSGRPGRMGLARNTATSRGRAASPALISFCVWKRGTLNRRGGTNQTHLLPRGRKGQSMTKALLL